MLVESLLTPRIANAHRAAKCARAAGARATRHIADKLRVHLNIESEPNSSPPKYENFASRLMPRTVNVLWDVFREGRRPRACRDKARTS